MGFFMLILMQVRKNQKGAVSFQWLKFCCFSGNLLAMANGKLCYLDFGMVSYVEPAQRYNMIEAVVHMVNRDFRALSLLYRKMGFIPANEDIEPIVQALEVRMCINCVFQC